MAREFIQGSERVLISQPWAVTEQRCERRLFRSCRQQRLRTVIQQTVHFEAELALSECCMNWSLMRLLTMLCKVNFLVSQNCLPVPAKSSMYTTMPRSSSSRREFFNPWETLLAAPANQTTSRCYLFGIGRPPRLFPPSDEESCAYGYQARVLRSPGADREFLKA